MNAVRFGDIGPVAWTMGFAFRPCYRSGKLSRWGRALATVWAVVSWPCWAFFVLVLPGFVHSRRTVVAQVVRPRHRVSWRGVSVLLAVVVVALGLIIAFSVSSPALASTAIEVLKGLLLAVAFSMVCVVIGIGPSTARTMCWATPALATLLDRKAWAADRARLKEVTLEVSALAGRGDKGEAAMVTAVEHLITNHPGEIVRVSAGNPRVHRLYERRWGLVPLQARRWHLVGDVPTQAPLVSTNSAPKALP